MKNKGYTLIELVTVMMLLSIIMLIAIPKFRVDTMTHKTVAKNLYTDIKKIRARAMEGSTKAKIVFNSENKYTIFDENYEKEIVLGDNICLRNKDGGLITAGLRMQFSITGIFQPTQRNDPQTITIEDETKNFYDITILPVTGRIRLYEENEKAPVRQ